MLHDPLHVTFDIILEQQISIGRGRHAPVEKIRVKPRVNEMLDDAPPFLEIQNVRPINQGKNKEEGWSARGGS